MSSATVHTWCARFDHREGTNRHGLRVLRLRLAARSHDYGDDRARNILLEVSMPAGGRLPVKHGLLRTCVAACSSTRHPVSALRLSCVCCDPYETHVSLLIVLRRSADRAGCCVRCGAERACYRAQYPVHAMHSLQVVSKRNRDLNHWPGLRLLRAKEASDGAGGARELRTRGNATPGALVYSGGLASRRGGDIMPVRAPVRPRRKLRVHVRARTSRLQAT